MERIEDNLLKDYEDDADFEEDTEQWSSEKVW